MRMWVELIGKEGGRFELLREWKGDQGKDRKEEKSCVLGLKVDYLGSRFYAMSSCSCF